LISKTHRGVSRRPAALATCAIRDPNRAAIACPQLSASACTLNHRCRSEASKANAAWRQVLLIGRPPVKPQTALIIGPCRLANFRLSFASRDCVYSNHVKDVT
jgi:hypothetical protein